MQQVVLQLFHIVPDVSGALVATRAVLLQEPEDDSLQRERNRGIDAAWRRWRRVENGVDDERGHCSLEGRARAPGTRGMT